METRKKEEKKRPTDQDKDKNKKAPKKSKSSTTSEPKQESAQTDVVQKEVFVKPDMKRGIVAHLTCSSAEKAIEFYKNAFGATVRFQQLAKEIAGKPGVFLPGVTDTDTRIVHAELHVNNTELLICDDFEKEKTDPLSLGGCPVTLNLTLETPSEVDELTQRAKENGAVVLMEPKDMFWGDRFSRIKDPQGFVWALIAHLPKKI